MATVITTTEKRFSKPLYTEAGGQYELIAKIKETSSTSTQVTCSIKVYLKGTSEGVGYKCTYGNKLVVSVGSTSLINTSNVTNGEWTISLSYNVETLIWEGSFTMTRGTNYALSVTFDQTQWSGWFNATISDTICGLLAGSVYTKPTAISGLRYTGSARTLINAGAGTGTMYYRVGTSGSYSTALPTATNAGTYTVYYYAAASGSYAQSSTGSVSVTISKANGWVTLSATGGGATYGSPASTLKVNSSHGGTLSISSSDTSVATVSLSGTTISITPVKPGNTTITVTSAATTNHTAASAKYPYEVWKTFGWVTLSKDSSELNAGTTSTFTVTDHHGGTLSVSSSDTSVATASLSGTTITITPVARSGSAVITVTSAATSTHDAADALHTVSVRSQTFSVFLDNGTSFEEYQVFIDNGTSWEQYIPYYDTGSFWLDFQAK
jgi:hypothetical protein